MTPEHRPALEAEIHHRIARIADWSAAFERIRKGMLPAEFDGLDLEPIAHEVALHMLGRVYARSRHDLA